MNIENIIKRKEEQIAEEKLVVDENQMEQDAARYHRIPLSVEGALKKDHLAVIAPVSKADPQKKVTRHHFCGDELGREFEKDGLDALMVSTDRIFYQGKAEYIGRIRSCVHIPIILHDFIVDPYQIYQALVLGADGIILMTAALDVEMLIRFVRIAHECGLQCLIEAHSLEETKGALECGANIIMIQNADLDGNGSLQNTQDLVGLVPADKIVASAGCIQTLSDLETVCSWGANAAVPSTGVVTRANARQVMEAVDAFGAPGVRKTVALKKPKKSPDNLDFPSLKDVP